MSIHWAAARTTWTAHTKGQAVYSLKHLHPMLVTMEVEVHKSPRQVQLHIGFASHVFTRAADSADNSADIYKDDRERRAFDAERYELSLTLPELVHKLCEGKAKCYFGKNNNFFVFRSLQQRGVEYRAFFDVDRWPEKGKNALVLIVQSAYRANIALQAPGGRRDKPVRFKVLLTRAMEGVRLRPPP